ncbi:MAG TPA: ABC transporter permease subunit [Candidatus Saccharimonadales bacterium]|nr:ABC transporter permease subunit [Candidatus Saccharimonadales bacterium]
MKEVIALVRWELWQRRWSLVWWAVGVAALISIDMLLYGSIKNETAQLSQVYDSLPANARALFSDSGDFLTPVGYLSARVYYLLLPLLLSIFSIGLGANLLGREEQQGTLEMLLARPISRAKLLFSKLLAGSLALGWLAFTALVIAWACLRASGFSEISYGAVAIATLAAILLAALFGMIAFAFTALGKPARSAALGIASLFAFMGYIVASLESTIHWLSWPSKLLPYHYYQPSSILDGTGHPVGNIAGFCVVIAVLAVVSWYGFRGRDIS